MPRGRRNREDLFDPLAEDATDDADVADDDGVLEENEEEDDDEEEEDDDDSTDASPEPEPEPEPPEPKPKRGPGRPRKRRMTVKRNPDGSSVEEEYSPEIAFVQAMDDFGHFVQTDPERWEFMLHRVKPVFDREGIPCRGKIACPQESFTLEWVAKHHGAGTYRLLVLGPADPADPRSPRGKRREVPGIEIAPLSVMREAAEEEVEEQRKVHDLSRLSKPPKKVAEEDSPAAPAPSRYAWLPQPREPSAPAQPPVKADEIAKAITEAVQVGVRAASEQHAAKADAAKELASSQASLMDRAFSLISERPNGQSEEARRLHDLVARLEKELSDARHAAQIETSNLRTSHLKELGDERERFSRQLAEERARGDDVRTTLTAQHAQHVEVVKQGYESRVATLQSSVEDYRRQSDDYRRRIETLESEARKLSQDLFTAQLEAKTSAAQAAVSKPATGELEGFAKTFGIMKSIASEILPGAGAAAAAAAASEAEAPGGVVGVLGKGLDVAKTALESEGLRRVFGSMADRIAQGRAAQAAVPQVVQPTGPVVPQSLAPPQVVAAGADDFAVFKRTLGARPQNGGGQPTLPAKSPQVPRLKQPVLPPQEEPPEEDAVDFVERAAASGMELNEFAEVLLSRYAGMSREEALSLMAGETNEAVVATLEQMVGPVSLVGRHYMVQAVGALRA